MTVLEVRPERAGWVVADDRRELSTHATADAAVRAARSVLEREDADAELIVRDRYSCTRHIAVPRR
jgi:uncharacterized protein DUF2188